MTFVKNTLIFLLRFGTWILIVNLLVNGFHTLFGLSMDIDVNGRDFDFSYVLCMVLSIFTLAGYDKVNILTFIPKN